MKTIRECYRTSGIKLRRARKLYIFFIRHEVKRSPDMYWIYAQRAKSRGLYAETTQIKDVCFSLVRGVYKLDHNIARQGWFGWQRENECKAIWNSLSRWSDRRMRNCRPVLRIRG